MLRCCMDFFFNILFKDEFFSEMKTTVLKIIIINLKNNDNNIRIMNDSLYYTD